MKLSQRANGNVYHLGPKPAWFSPKGEKIMGTLEIILLVVVLLFLFGGLGGGGYFWSRRRR